MYTNDDFVHKLINHFGRFTVDPLIVFYIQPLIKDMYFAIK